MVGASRNEYILSIPVVRNSFSGMNRRWSFVIGLSPASKGSDILLSSILRLRGKAKGLQGRALFVADRSSLIGSIDGIRLTTMTGPCLFTFNLLLMPLEETNPRCLFFNSPGSGRSLSVAVGGQVRKAPLDGRFPGGNRDRLPRTPVLPADIQVLVSCLWGAPLAVEHRADVRPAAERTIAGSFRLLADDGSRARAPGELEPGSRRPAHVPPRDFTGQSRHLRC